MLQQVRSALAGGDGGRALRGLDQYDRRGTRLRTESTILRIEALARVGRRAEAAVLAQRFVADHPTDPLVDRARAYLPEPADANPQ